MLWRLTFALGWQIRPRTSGQARGTTQEDSAAATTNGVLSSNELTVRFLDVGQGDALIAFFPDGKTLVVDAGQDGGQTVVDALERVGRTRIDWLVATHPDADHIGGMPTILDTVDVGDVFAPEVSHTTRTYTNFLTAVERNNLYIHAAYAGNSLEENADYQIDILWPPKDASFSETNDYSIVLKLTYKETSFLLTGDAPAEALRAIGEQNIDVLKVSHHGSASGMTYALARSLRPQFAVISYGLNNDYGHPTQLTMDALTKVGTQIYGTGAQGTITIATDGTHIDVSTERAGEVEAESKRAGSRSRNLSYEDR